MHGNSQNTAPVARPQGRPRDPQPYRLYHDFGGSAELTSTLAHALSDLTGADVTEAEFQLNEYVDPQALDRLFRPSGGASRPSGHVGFTVWNYEVTVYNDGQIVIAPPREPQPPAPNV